MLSEWRPQGMFERIVGKCPPDLFTQSSSLSLVNVNTRQRETKKPEPQTSVEQYVEKGISIYFDFITFNIFY